MSPTIYALSSGRPPAGIAVVRVSGPAAFAALAALTPTPLPPLRMMTLANLRDPADATLLDRALVVRFAAPASATGDDLVELHLHGGVAVVAAVLRVLATVPGLALAAPGAFTRRAFDNGRLDLAQVEALADLIDADTEAARRQALAQLGGGLSTVVDSWRATLIDLMADTEARLDFAEAEDDVAAAMAQRQQPQLSNLHREVATALAAARRGERLRDGLTIAITGAPNVGKSSLLNILARRDVAIVTDRPGTTRDVIEARLDLAGVAVTLLDTAGLRDARDPVEREGIRRGVERAAAADLVLNLGRADDPACNVVTKIDLTGDRAGHRDGRWFVSAWSGGGIAELVAGLADWAAETARPGEPALITRERHRLALNEVDAELSAAAGETDPVLVAEHLRRSARALGTIIGAVGVDDILGAIFSQFCIGK